MIKTQMIKTHRWLLATLLSMYGISAIAAQVCLPESQYPNQWKDSRYTDHSNGTVTDNNTNLMWAKCSLGQNATACSGSATTYTWKQALEAASNSTLAEYSDWRLPNIKEIGSLSALNCLNPTINLNLFPNTPTSAFWASSPYAGSSGNAWIFFFFGGSDGNESRDRNGYSRVRLVRGGSGS
jgi:hypothetical protein